jgi:gas vesicle protein
MKVKSLLTGFITGTVVAGAAVLLSSPTSGKELRNRTKTSRLEMNEIAKEIKTRVMNMKEDVIVPSKISKETITAFSQDVKNLLDNWKKEIEPNKEELTKNMKEIEAKVQELEEITASPTQNTNRHFINLSDH